MHNQNFGANCYPVNPISSNQVTEVCIPHPRCAPTTLKTLNDWMKWLAEKQCEIDWSTIDLSCINTYVDGCNCEQTQKVVIETIIKGVCQALSCCDSNSNLEVFYNLTIEDEWESSTANPAIARKQGRSVMLQGKFRRNTNDNAPVIILPTELRPAYNLRFPIATDHTGGPYSLLIEIQPSGNVMVVFVDANPDQDSWFHLNGISYILPQ